MRDKVALEEHVPAEAMNALRDDAGGSKRARPQHIPAAQSARRCSRLATDEPANPVLSAEWSGGKAGLRHR
jgi:hypothetical protein